MERLGERGGTSLSLNIFTFRVLPGLAIWKLSEPYPFRFLQNCGANRLGGETQQGLSVQILLAFFMQRFFLPSKDEDS